MTIFVIVTPWWLRHLQRPAGAGFSLSSRGLNKVTVDVAADFDKSRPAARSDSSWAPGLRRWLRQVHSISSRRWLRSSSSVLAVMIGAWALGQLSLMWITTNANAEDGCNKIERIPVQFSQWFSREQGPLVHTAMMHIFCFVFLMFLSFCVLFCYVVLFCYLFGCFVF